MKPYHFSPYKCFMGRMYAVKGKYEKALESYDLMPNKSNEIYLDMEDVCYYKNMTDYVRLWLLRNNYDKVVYIHIALCFDYNFIETGIECIIELCSMCRCTLIFQSCSSDCNFNFATLSENERWRNLQTLVDCVAFVLPQISLLGDEHIVFINSLKCVSQLMLRVLPGYTLDFLFKIKVPYSLVALNSVGNNIPKTLYLLTEDSPKCKNIITKAYFPIAGACASKHCEYIQIRANNDQIMQETQRSSTLGNTNIIQNVSLNHSCSVCENENTNAQRCCSYENLNSFNTCCAVTPIVLCNYIYHTYGSQAQVVRTNTICNTSKTYCYYVFCTIIDNRPFSSAILTSFNKDIFPCDISVLTV